jgi:hypothetical protein
MRLKAVAVHLTISVAIALVCATLTFGVWYPNAYRAMSGGMGVFGILTIVDVVLGPLLTLVVFNSRKPRTELVTDLSAIGVLQISALAYGLVVVYQARPVHLVFEVDRYRVISAADIDDSDLPDALPAFRKLPRTGPTIIAAKGTSSREELLKSLEMAMQGKDIATRPKQWVPLSEQRTEIGRRALHYTKLLERKPEHRVVLETAARKAMSDSGLPPERLRTLPVVSRFVSWTVIIDESGTPLAFAPVDAF